MKYHDQYINNIEFDNFFITKYFKRIDARRMERGDRNLLPLKKVERTEYIEPESARRGKKEFQHSAFHIIKILLEIITATIFVLFDYLFTEMLMIIKRHALVEFTQEGSHKVNITVTGRGLIASLVRSAIDNFQTDEELHLVMTNEPCLPRAHKLNNHYLYKIYGIYILILFLIYYEMYFQRLRRLFCSYFYPKREKARVLYLYNKMLKRRRGLFKRTYQDVMEKIKNKEWAMEVNIFTVHIMMSHCWYIFVNCLIYPSQKLRVNYPRCCDWMRIFECTKRQCAICEELEPYRSEY